ncbi:V-type ATP synthase subunit E [Fonticella tunisiensis]|uniref:V-type proton ATPase subunit E n=1 Tax=Fonticella tunisiensis TaxID=1096341 RepID=A0A4R7KBE5_9CLOT|nr:V-type ATP synthase subunit E [Fonticella tunisiensis]TDT50937.1 V/A-type H+-transporting ATPase subunit E [Fonticella tunisiensis]
MAGIENLKSRILRDSEEQARQIENEARARADEIVKSAKLRAEEILEEFKAKAERDGRDRRDRIIARAQLDLRNAVLAAKQEAIDKVLNTAIRKIQFMSVEEYTNFIERLLLSNIETGDEEVIFSENDKNRIDPDLLKRVNKKLQSEGKKGQLKISGEVRNISSGFILKREGLEVNCSIEAQIRALRDSLQGDIANLLFS